MNNLLPLRLLLWLTIVVGFFVAFTPNSFAAEGDALLSDNFNDGNLDGWTIESGNWYINNGNLAGSKSGKAFIGKISNSPSEWDNYRLELDVNGFQGIDQGIGIRYTTSGSYEIRLRYGTGAHNTPQIILYKNTGTETASLTDTHSFPLIN